MGVVGFSLSQARLKGDADRWTRKERRKGRGMFGGRRAEAEVELTIRRRPAGSSLGSPLAERIYRNGSGNARQTIRVPQSQAGRVRRELDRDGYRIERSRVVR